MAETLQYAVGKAYAVYPLSQWEGFHQYCQDTVGINPLVLLQALVLERGDPAAELRQAYPSAKADEAEITQWTAEWARTWKRRFPAAAPVRSILRGVLLALLGAGGKKDRQKILGKAGLATLDS